jgi:hypothetical protein
MQKIGIVVPQRPEYGNAYWTLQRKFDSGFHLVEVTDEQLEELRADPIVTVLESAALDAAVAAQATAPEVETAPVSDKPGKPMKRS